MTYLVTFAMQNGLDATVSVVAPNKDEAEYRAAWKAESIYDSSVSYVKVCRKSR